MLHHVLRIQHPENGKGPFRFSEVQECPALDICNDAAWALGTLPAGAMDDIDAFALASQDFVCGVEYFGDFLYWFEQRHLQALADLGFKLYLFTVPKKKILFSESGKQVAFNRADAVEVIEL